MKKRGFTLAELLVVIAILAILATVSVIGYTSFIKNAEQQKADTEAAQIKKAIEGALVVDEELYLGKSDERNCYFSQKGLRVNGLIVTEETVLTSLAGDLSHLEGTLISYPSGYFTWITGGGASSMFRVEIEGVSVDSDFDGLKAYLENYFLTNDECLIGTYMGRKVYVNSNWEVFVEQSPAMNYVPGPTFDVDTDINPEVHAITPSVKVTKLSQLMFMQMAHQSVSVFARYGYDAYLSYKDENGEEQIVAKGENICAEIFIKYWKGFFGNSGTVSIGKANADNGEVHRYVALVDIENGEYRLARDLGNEEYEVLEAGAYIYLDAENDTMLLGELSIGVEADGSGYLYIENGIYNEKIYLNEVFAR